MDAKVISPTRVGKPNRTMVGLQSLLEADLLRVEALFQDTLNPFRERFPKLIDRLAHYSGKRLRPALVLLFGHALHQVNRSHHLVATCLELIHTATLVHDDVLDEAELRRHTNTVNATWGNKTAILLGDLLFTSAFHLSSKLGEARLCEWIGEATNRVCAGELQQTLNGGNYHLTEKEYYSIIEGKTAALTECAARLGAIYGGATPQQIQAASIYGRSLGMAFQIADDLLDLVGDVQKVGKTLGTDLAQGKMTLPLLYLFDRLPVSEVQQLKEQLTQGQPEVSEQLVHLLNSTNSLQDARRMAISFISQAQSAIQCYPASIYRDALEQIADWSLSRQT